MVLNRVLSTCVACLPNTMDQKTMRSFNGHMWFVSCMMVKPSMTQVVFSPWPAKFAPKISGLLTANFCESGLSSQERKWVAEILPSSLKSEASVLKLISCGSKLRHMINIVLSKTNFPLYSSTRES